MSGLSLNFITCKLERDIFEINYLPYSNYNTIEKYAMLRDSNRDYNFIRLNDKICYWPNKEQEDKFSGKSIKIKVSDYPFLIRRILDKSITNRFVNEAAYRTYLSKYDGCWVLEAKKDLLNGNIEGLKAIQKVYIRAEILFPEKQSIIGLSVSPKIRNRFTWTRDDFVENGIDTKGLKGKENIIFANKESIKRFLTARGKEDFYNNTINKYTSNKSTFGLLKKFYNWLQKHKDEIYLPSQNGIYNLEMNYLPINNNEIKHLKLPNPVRKYYHAPSNDKNHKYNDMLRIYKPYTFESFYNEKIKVGVLCPKEYEGSLEQFLLKLETVLKRDTHLYNFNFKLIFTDDTSLNSYKEKLYSDDLLKSNLVIIVINDEHEKLDIPNSPYYYCKAKFIGNGIPTQDIKIRNIRNCNQYILNNISLNIYAKLGGTAWTIEKDDKIKEELIIGIGSTIDENKKQVLGIAQVFNSDGKYLVGDCSILSTFNNYAENLEKYLYETLKELFNNFIETKEEFRLIFHLYKSPSKKYEIKAIENIISRFNEYTFKFALIHLSYGHNFNLFYNDGNGDISKGVYIKLDKFRSLIHFVPKSRVPLYVELDKRSTYIDIYDLSKQIYWFANLSHRSYNPSKKTVTLMYPSLMARMMEKLKYIEAWDYDRLKRVKDKLWFI